MAKKFVRNITGTNLGGNKLSEQEGKIEPFTTNVQNDILSDDEDIFIRQVQSEKVEDGYICLTDNIKQVKNKSDLLHVDNENKNEVSINVNKSSKTESEEGTINNKVMTPLQTKYAIDKNNKDVIPTLVKEHETETEITSVSDELKVTKTSKNQFELELVKEDEANYLSSFYDSTDLFRELNGRVAIKDGPTNQTLLTENNLLEDNTIELHSVRFSKANNSKYNNYSSNTNLIKIVNINSSSSSRAFFELNLVGEGNTSKITDEGVDILKSLFNYLPSTNANVIKLSMINIETLDRIVGVCLINSTNFTNLEFKFNKPLNEIQGRFIID